MYFRFCLYLLGSLAVAFLSTGTFLYRSMTEDARSSAQKHLTNLLKEVREQYNEASQKVKILTDMNNHSMLARTRSVAEIIRIRPDILDDAEALQKLCNENLADSLTVCGKDGSIRAATHGITEEVVQEGDYLDMLACAEGEEYESTALADNSGQPVRLAAVRRKDAPGVVILSFFMENEQRAREKSSLSNLLTDMVVGDKGYIIAFVDGVRITQSVLPASEAELRSLPLDELVEQRLNDEDFFLYATVRDGMKLIGVVPTGEYYAVRAKGMKLQGYILLVCLTVGFVVLYLLLRHYVLQDTDKLNKAIKLITAGNIDSKIKESTSPEFRQLTVNINTMLDSLRGMDDDIREQNRNEAELARSIKESILPNPAQLFAGRADFSVVATVVQSDTVGGDFYDCLMTDDDHLLFVLSSIDAQGIPAALLMMYWLAVLRSYSWEMMPPAEIVSHINRGICRSEDSRVLISMFIGCLEISTGKVSCVNAGVHVPLRQRVGEEFCELDIPVLPPCGENMNTEYVPSEFSLEPGDRLFLCTNALTCLLNERHEFFGEPRLRASLKEAAPTLRDIPHLVRAAVRRFIGNQKRTRDYSMLCLELPGQHHSLGAVSVSPGDTAAPEMMIRRTLEEVFAAPSDIEIILNATQTVMAAIPHAPTVRITLRCTERHARVSLTYSGPERDILQLLPKLQLDSTSYHHLDNVNNIVLYKEIE